MVKVIKMKSTPKHKLFSMLAALLSVAVLLVITFASLQYTRSVGTEPGLPNLCQSLGAETDVVTIHGWIIESYSMRENSCTGYVLSYRPAGLVINMVPGLVIAGLTAYAATRYLRRSMR